VSGRLSSRREWTKLEIPKARDDLRSPRVFVQPLHGQRVERVAARVLRNYR
jgi:hypothetical protein